MDIQLDITRAEEELGYQPAYDLEQGLAEILAQEITR
jgi:nucleoside-diphosphate-sugar epimerase